MEQQRSTVVEVLARENCRRVQLNELEGHLRDALGKATKHTVATGANITYM